jgi:hypothetical protein
VDDSLVSAVKHVLDELDPEGLLGVEGDEYLADAKDLVLRMEQGHVMTPELVEALWVVRFHTRCGLVRYKLAGPLAERLNALVSSKPD